MPEVLPVLDDLGILAVDDVLVAEGGRGRSVAGPNHARLEAGAAGGGEGGRGVAGPWNRSPVTPASAVVDNQTRRRYALRRINLPSMEGITSPSLAGRA